MEIPLQRQHLRNAWIMKGVHHKDVFQVEETVNAKALSQEQDW